ncbi:hypothetical protein [Collimonas sp. PA-H2]|uniref:hypothetical protein n=1 Tax=Collimonas sp. PA-H2 TaxID=1881062 RepID=UPI00117DA8DE|nr:hypothetical protein [Collimonas sp. PA-H2]
MIRLFNMENLVCQMSYAQISKQAQAAIACSQIDAWVSLENDGRLAATVAACQPILKTWPQQAPGCPSRRKRRNEVMPFQDFCEAR